MEKQTPAFGKIYTVTSHAGCTVTDAATLKLLQTCPAGVQTPFVACGPSVIISDDAALFAGPFDFARVPLGSSGGAGAPLTPDQLTALENAVGGKLENVSIVPQEATKAAGWISSTAWSEIAVGAELCQINGTPFLSHGSTTAETLAAAINETLGDLVTATAADANTINLESLTAGAAANSITLSTADTRIFLSGDTLTGGQDEVKPSIIFWVDNEGIHFSNIPDNAVLYTNGMKINTMGGNVYHGTGSATFKGSKTTAVVDGTHFEVRRNDIAGNPLILHVGADANEVVYIKMGDAFALAEENEVITTGSTKQLQHMGVYKVTAMGTVDLQGLTVAAPAASGKYSAAITAQLLINYAAGSVVFPASWVWLDGSAPTMEAGKNYCIAIRRDGQNIVANKAYEYTRPA